MARSENGERRRALYKARRRYGVRLRPANDPQVRRVLVLLQAAVPSEAAEKIAPTGPVAAGRRKS